MAALAFLTQIGLYMLSAFGLRDILVQFVAASLFLALVAAGLKKIFG